MTSTLAHQANYDMLKKLADSMSVAASTNSSLAGLANQTLWDSLEAQSALITKQVMTTDDADDPLMTL